MFEARPSRLAEDRVGVKQIGQPHLACAAFFLHAFRHADVPILRGRILWRGPRDLQLRGIRFRFQSFIRNGEKPNANGNQHSHAMRGCQELAITHYQSSRQMLNSLGLGRSTESSVNVLGMSKVSHMVCMVSDFILFLSSLERLQFVNFWPEICE